MKGKQKQIIWGSFKLFCIMLLVAGAVFSAGCGDSDSSDEAPLFGASDIDPEAGESENRATKGLAYRASADGSLRASYVQITPNSGGGTFGNAIRLFENGKMVFAKFMPFDDAISKGNSFIQNGRVPIEYETEATEETTESTDEAVILNATKEKFEKDNIKTIVSPNNLSGYNVLVYVDNDFVIRVYKDCNLCSIFSKDKAVSRAQEYLDLLQGWKS